jgi:ZIP family zinc transporter
MLVSIVMSTLAGLSTTFGAFIVFLLPSGHISDEQMVFTLALAGGVMLSATILEFWLPVLMSPSPSGAWRVVSSSSIGILAYLILSRLVPEPQVASRQEDLERGKSSPKGDLSQHVRDGDGFSNDECNGGIRDEHSWHIAKVLLLSLTAHNFPEGFAVAVSSFGEGSLGSVVMFAIAMHNIPEGIAIAVPVLAATGSRKKALLMTFLSGMAEPIGALLAQFFVHATGAAASQDGIENLLCVVGGVMAAVAVCELLPDALHYRKPVSFINGAAVGSVLMLITVSFGA